MEGSTSSIKEGEWIMAVIKRISSKANPKKIVKYLTQEEKTEEKLIGGKDCDPDNVVNNFDVTQELYGKTTGVRYHHIIQSFSPEDDITPEKAHELGMELAEKQFKGFEVFVVTHKDKEHIHNHFVVNSVSFETGLKYNASNKSLWDIKRESNKICEREHLQVLDLEHKADKRISSAEKRIMDRGQIPWKDELRQCIDVARERTKDLQGFREFLEKNFEIETRITKSSISYKHPDHGKAIRGRSLGARYNKEELENEFNGQERAVLRNGEGATSSTNVNWSAIRDNVKGEGNRISEQPSNDVLGEIQRKVREVKDRTDRIIGIDKSEGQGPRGQQPDIQQDNKSRNGENQPSNIRAVEDPEPKVREVDWGFER